MDDGRYQKSSNHKKRFVIVESHKTQSGRYDKVPDDLTVFAGIDLAIGRKEGNARFAYIVLGVDKVGDILLLDGYRDRIPFTDQLSSAKRINRLHHPRLIVVETNAYQTVFVESLRTDPETRHLPLKDQTTQGDKDARLRGLAPLFQNGIIRLPRSGGPWVDQLIEELLHFPNGTKDMLDALWLAIQGIELQRTEPRIIFADDDTLNKLKQSRWFNINKVLQEKVMIL